MHYLCSPAIQYLLEIFHPEKYTGVRILRHLKPTVG
jgi:hypothetical protein